MHSYLQTTGFALHPCLFQFQSTIPFFPYFSCWSLQQKTSTPLTQAIPILVISLHTGTHAHTASWHPVSHLFVTCTFVHQHTCAHAHTMLAMDFFLAVLMNTSYYTTSSAVLLFACNPARWHINTSCTHYHNIP